MLSTQRAVLSAGPRRPRCRTPPLQLLYSGTLELIQAAATSSLDSTTHRSNRIDGDTREKRLIEACSRSEGPTASAPVMFKGQSYWAA
jgi:hypothetical protein